MGESKGKRFFKIFFNRKESGFLIILFLCFVFTKSFLIEGNGFQPENINLSSAQKRLLGRRAAIVDAYRNALIHLHKFDASKWDVMPYQGINISGRIAGARIIKTEYIDNKVIVTVFIPLEKIRR